MTGGVSGAGSRRSSLGNFVGGGGCCYEKFNVGDRVSGAQCIEAQESLAAKRGVGGRFIVFTLKTLDIKGILSYNIPMLTVLATYDQAVSWC